MKKIVKGKIEKHYCDVCGKNIFDYIPKESTVKFMGQWIPEYSIKRHCEFERRRGKECCQECWGKQNAN